MIVLAVVIALLAAALFVALRRVRTSYPPPRYQYRIGIDIGRNSIVTYLAEERIAMSINRPESFVLIGSLA